jgi:hypothetical protein
MNSILAWIKSKNLSSHTVLIGATSLAVLISTDQQVQTLIVSTLKSHPALASDIILLATVLAKFSHSTKQADAKPPVDGANHLNLNS